MQYNFTGSYTIEEAGGEIKIPFNVWEVCEGMGLLSATVTTEGVTYDCDLVPEGKGRYYIPVSDKLQERLTANQSYKVVMKLQDSVTHINVNSPYTSANPIRKVDSVNLVTQPFDGLCGQAVIAMLAGISLDEACDIMHCREWQASMGKIIETLDYFCIPHANEINYTGGAEVELPKCCIIMEMMGRYSHYLIRMDGRYYDPTVGCMDNFNVGNMNGYLEIL